MCLFLTYALHVYAATCMVQLLYACYMDLNFALSNLPMQGGHTFLAIKFPDFSLI